MIIEFIDFAQTAIPSISPYKAKVAQEAVREFLKGRNTIVLARRPEVNDILQGDIIGPLVFSFIDNDGNLQTKESYAFVLSNSCDIENDFEIVLCACYPLERFSTIFSHIKSENLLKNEYGALFYITTNSREDHIACFSDCVTYGRDLIFRLLKEGRIQRIASLTQVGWYFFLLKLTYHFMRPEDSETNQNRIVL